MPPATACPLEGGGSLVCLPPRRSPPRATRQHHAQAIRLTAVSLLLGTHTALGAVLSTPRPRPVPSVTRSSGYKVQSNPGAPDRACPPLPPSQPLPNAGADPPRFYGCANYSAGGAFPKPGVLARSGPYRTTKTRLLGHWTRWGRGARGSAVRRPLYPSDFPRGAPPAPPHGRGGFSPSHPQIFYSTLSLRCKPCLRHRYAATGLTACLQGAEPCLEGVTEPSGNAIL